MIFLTKASIGTSMAQPVREWHQRRRRYPFPVTFRPESLQARGTGMATGPGEVDYRLVRKHTIDEFRRGRLSRLDVCDAHPELLRAARNVGEPAPHDCPICGSERVRYVSYVYGDTLKQANGRCITYPGELDKLDASFDEFACYVVEVCLDCRWNHLDRRYLLGRRHAG